MWNFNVNGFQSIVEYSPRTRQLDAKTKKMVDIEPEYMPEGFIPADDKKGIRSSHLLVRARVEGDLDAMKAYDPTAVVFEDLTADYQFRMIIRREAVAQFNYDQTMGVDYYSHVKEEMNRRSPKSAGRMSAYYSVWTALSRIQPNPPYGAGKWSATDWGWDKDPKAPKMTPGKVTPLIDWVGGTASKAGCDELWLDDPSPSMEQWEIDLVTDGPSRQTMEGQVKEFLWLKYETGDVEDITDRLETSYGTVDLDTLEEVAMWDAIDLSATSEDKEAVSGYTRRGKNGPVVVKGYTRSTTTNGK